MNILMKFSSKTLRGIVKNTKVQILYANLVNKTPLVYPFLIRKSLKSIMIEHIKLKTTITKRD